MKFWKSLFATLMLLGVLVAPINFILQVNAQLPAPDFSLTDIDGVEFSLSDYRGRVVLLDFFATWVGDCYSQITNLKSLHEEFGEDLVIISISSSELDTVEEVQQFRQQQEIDWIVAIDTANACMGHTISDVYVITTFPTSAILDQKWVWVYRHNGLTGESVLQWEINSIIPGFPSFLILPLFMIATLLAVTIYKRKHSM